MKTQINPFKENNVLTRIMRKIQFRSSYNRKFTPFL